jgi:hypothetical protein
MPVRVEDSSQHRDNNRRRSGIESGYVLPTFSNCLANAKDSRRFVMLPLENAFIQGNLPRPINCVIGSALTFKIESFTGATG